MMVSRMRREANRVSISANSIWLKVCFAVVSCLGGLVLPTADATHIPLIAVFGAVFGFIFVDWLRFFSLPPILAYIAMGAAAIYSVGDFWSVSQPGNRQMLSVAQLLVMVQAILMLQEKSARIYEQLAVFCLLQLVVAAVFNEDLNYWVMLGVVGSIGTVSLSLLACLSAAEGIAADAPKTGNVRISSPRSIRSIQRSGSPLSRFAIFSAVPAIVSICCVFFYALPQRTDASNADSQGKVLTGFSDRVKLDQIGQMLQSEEPAMRVSLLDRWTEAPYDVAGGIYLRGKILENYFPDQNSQSRPSAIWTSVIAHDQIVPDMLPIEFVPPRTSDKHFFDSVRVNVSCEAMQSPSLFSIAPYYRTGGTNGGVRHTKGSWTLVRRDRRQHSFPRMDYGFVTHAFHNGLQTDLIAIPDRRNTPESFGRGFSLTDADILNIRLTGGRTYLQYLLSFNENSMPTVAKTARLVLSELPGSQKTNKMQWALALQRYLALHGRFRYTLDLNSKPQPGVDPIEQFVASDRKGHCQYFASALVMMLRSVGIPARMVVGFHTDEYNEIGQYFLARQSHAHAWVEALIDRQDLEEGQLIYGQPEADKYWIRLDPTPGGGGTASVRSSVRGVDEVLDMARDLFGDILYRAPSSRLSSASNRETDITLGDGVGRWIKDRLARLRNGNLHWNLELVGFVCVFAALLVGTSIGIRIALRRSRWGRSITRRIRHTIRRSAPANDSDIRFYTDALREIRRLGLQRKSAQTPAEFSGIVATQLGSLGATDLANTFEDVTQAFCAVRYGQVSQQRASELVTKLRDQATHLRQRLTREEHRRLKSA